MSPIARGILTFSRWRHVDLFRRPRTARADAVALHRTRPRGPAPAVPCRRINPSRGSTPTLASLTSNCSKRPSAAGSTFTSRGIRSPGGGGRATRSTPRCSANWRQNFFGWNAADFGWGGDTTQNILWRLQNGELDAVHPKVIVLLAGTNNIGRQPADDAKVAEITRGIKAIVDLCHQKAPDATIILTAIFPRNDNPAVMPSINRINENLARLADGKRVRFLNVNDKLADKGGKLFDGMMGDRLHPTVKGYQVWADGLQADPHRTPGPTRRHRPRPAADRRPERDPQARPLHATDD